MDNPEIISDIKQLQRGLIELRDLGLLLDFKIIVEGTTFLAHKTVLAAMSGYFRVAITNQMKESKTNELVIEGICPSTMKAILDFCYTFDIDLNEENVADISMAASRFCIDAVQRKCNDFLMQRIDVNNCLDVFLLAESCNLHDLKRLAYDFCVENFETVCKDNEFLHIDSSIMQKFTSNDNLNISEKDLFDNLVRWANKYPEIRAPLFDSLAKHVRFTQMEARDLVNYSTLDLVKNSSSCKDAIEAAKNYLLLKHSPGDYQMTLPEINVIPRENLRNKQRIYMLGGWAELYKALSDAEVYDPILDRWEEMMPMRTRRCGLGCAVLGDYIYAVGGHDGQSYLKSLERYDTVKKEWLDDIKDMSCARTSLGVVELNERLYAIGGETCNGATDKVERYDPVMNEWSEVRPLNQKRFGAGVTVLDGHIYVVGGADKTKVFDSVEKYDPKTDEWTFVTSMRTARKHLGCTSFGRKIYVIAGRKLNKDESIELDSTEVYDPITDSWSELPSMHRKRSGVSVVEIRKQIYAMGGLSGDNHLNIVESYDIETRQWQSRAPMLSVRLGGGVVVHPIKKFC